MLCCCTLQPPAEKGSDWISFNFFVLQQTFPLLGRKYQLPTPNKLLVSKEIGQLTFSATDQIGRYCAIGQNNVFISVCLAVPRQVTLSVWLSGTITFVQHDLNDKTTPKIRTKKKVFKEHPQSPNRQAVGFNQSDTSFTLCFFTPFHLSEMCGGHPRFSILERRF